MTESRPPRARQIPCARCGKPTLFTSANPFRPFCSERCKLIDLGNWADGRYAIPIQPATGTEAETGEPAEADADEATQDFGALDDKNANRSSIPGDE